MTEPSELTRPAHVDQDRRGFFVRVSVGLSALTGVVLGLPAIGFILGPLLRRTREKWRPVGKIDRFEPGSTTLVEFEDPSPVKWAGVTGRTGAWLRRDGEEEFIAFSINCRHLGCPVRWVPGAKLFMCPCHGGVYYSDGEVAAGPPPEALATYPVRVRDGQVEIRTSSVPLPGQNT